MSLTEFNLVIIACVVVGFILVRPPRKMRRPGIEHAVSVPWAKGTEVLPASGCMQKATPAESVPFAEEMWRVLPTIGSA